ncbi:unnamed protein product [Microthlaspi erraticum]|uniref:Uncharacterized protein n=1 Tax=Microthlaspi erraticum TaxID=1685480 RepID=A0A6D2JNG6_9BRAS|nr:unnamed protein product [Microthlaspi erraticum]
MDFIKTSSLRALIELTFQRNWNGLIWMSRNGVITKRVETVQTAYRRISAQPRSPAGRETIVSRSAKFISVRLKSRPKFETDRPITQHDPGNIVPRSAKLQMLHAAAHDHAARAGEQGLAAAQSVPRTTADASVRAGKERPTSRNHRPNHRPAEKPSAKIVAPTPRSTRSPF